MRPFHQHSYTAQPMNMTKPNSTATPPGWLAPRLTVLALTVLLAGCSTFQRDWKTSAQTPAFQSLEGRWEGTWHSEVNDHQNLLRCLITRQTNGLYSARFHAKYRRVFTWSFSYTVPLKVQRREDVFLFDGEARLGWYAGGRYDYGGHANATNFFSTYRCAYDHGTFQMTRPAR